MTAATRRQRTQSQPPGRLQAAGGRRPHSWPHPRPHPRPWLWARSTPWPRPQAHSTRTAPRAAGSRGRRRGQSVQQGSGRGSGRGSGWGSGWGRVRCGGGTSRSATVATWAVSPERSARRESCQGRSQRGHDLQSESQININFFHELKLFFTNENYFCMNDTACPI